MMHVFFGKIILMNNNIILQSTLMTPEELSGNFSRPPKIEQFIENSREIIKKITQGKENKLLVVVGPCSIHDTKAAMEYANKLKELTKKVQDHLFLVMRVYFEKPRTSLGWKGLIYDPHLDNSNDIITGLKIARELLLEINAIGVPVATEFVDTLVPQYLKDLVSWGAIGARTSKSQIHRQLVSSLPFAVGFKNSMSGNINAAINAVRAAQQPQTFLNINQQGIVCANLSSGNKNCHIILRGGRDHVNYGLEHITAAQKHLNELQLNPYLMVDCSHGNSHNKPELQARVIDALCKQLKDPNNPMVGVMIESNLKFGKQNFKPGEEHAYGVSITDGCISWEETEMLIQNLADAVKTRHREILYVD